ncbi:unnamed protein product [Trifolium pratense]|uniref:Uncharacterized protein n=1 Tax=Trifolium pratense TaxID=57577 RepID=A0ACB0JFA6_TRIPR|nr:unnamed protein product [Trifolium pratense]
MISLWMRITTRKGFLDMISFGSIQNLRANTLNYTKCENLTKFIDLARVTCLIYIGKTYDDVISKRKRFNFVEEKGSYLFNKQEKGISHSTEKSDHVDEKVVPVVPKSTVVAGTQEPQVDDSDTDTEEVVIFERDDGQGGEKTHEPEFVKSLSGHNNNDSKDAGIVAEQIQPDSTTEELVQHNNTDEGFVRHDISQVAQHASSSNNVPETPLLDQGNGIRVTQDLDLPLVAQQDVSLIRQAWVDMVEQEQFTISLQGSKEETAQES